MVDLRIKQIQAYDFKDAAAFLKSLWEINPMVSASSLDYKVRSLHTRKLRATHERRQAALFTFGMARRIPDFHFSFACVEDLDYDAVVRWYSEEEVNYTPIQLKELVPEHLNPKSSFERILSDLEKYKSSPDLIVVVFLNRKFTLDLTKMTALNLNLAGLYFIGAANRDKSEWYLIGDILKVPTVTKFDHPR